MKHKHTILALFLFGICASVLNAQADTYKTFDFIYVENSRSSPTDGLSQKQINKIEQQSKNIVKNKGKLIFFASNDNTPIKTTKPGDVSNLLYSFLENDAPYPRDKFEEKKRIREALYDDPFKTEESVNFHFYITDRFAASLENDIAPLIGVLPNEFAEALFFNKNIAVNIYINNNDKEIKIDKINQTLNYQKELLDLNISYNLRDL